MFRNRICSFSPLSENNCKIIFFYYEGIIPELGIKSKGKYCVLFISLYVTNGYIAKKSDIIFAFQDLIRQFTDCFGDEFGYGHMLGTVGLGGAVIRIEQFVLYAGWNPGEKSPCLGLLTIAEVFFLDPLKCLREFEIGFELALNWVKLGLFWL